jgi:A/G-specific adenine glycosylase
LPAYLVMVTEMLLRQTLAANVAQVWSEVTSNYPTARSMAQANRRRLEREVRRLGFATQRSEALISAARYLVEKHGGRVPRSLEALVKVPHLGMYSARAILCFAFGERIEIVDTNVLRFIGRYFGIKVKADIRHNPDAWKIARELLPPAPELASEHNYGMLDFTAEICRSRDPQCVICPLQDECKYGGARLHALGLKPARELGAS